MGVRFPGPTPTPRPVHGKGVDQGSLPGPEPRSEVFTFSGDAPTREEVKRWLDLQMAYPNLAGNQQIAEKALTYANQQKRYYLDRTFEIRDKWRALDIMLRGNSLSKRFLHADIHVPELYKMVETIVPRIEEAVFQNAGNGRSWFDVIGRDRLDKKKAWKIRAWLEYLVEVAGMEEHVQEAARCMVIYGFFAMKSWWDVKFVDKVVREYKKLKPTRSGEPRHRVSVKEQEVLDYYGPRYKLIDPYDFIVDTRCTDVQKGLYVGDITEMTFEELLEYQDLGWYTNVDLLKEKTPKKYDGTERRWAKFSRSLDSSQGVFDTRQAEGQPSTFEVTEYWLQFNPTDEGDGKVNNGGADEYVITVVNEEVCVQIRRNCHDDRHRPYAVGRSSREPFDFHNVGLLDHAVKLNIEMDEHRNLALKGHENSLLPLVFADPNDELPVNLFDVEPGEVFRTSRPPTFFQAPPTVGYMQQMDEVTRRDIEEIVGAPRIYEGQGQSGETATGIVRKIEEGNRRLRSVIRSFGHGMVDLLKHTYSLSAQFTTRRETFRVLGPLAAGNRLGPHTDIGPDELQMPVDFSIVGFDSIHTLGLRATNIATVLNQVFPLIQMLPPDRVDLISIMQTLWDNSVGVIPGEQVFKPDDLQDELLDPAEENILLISGQEIPVQPGDQDMSHIEQHMAFVGTSAFEKADDETKSTFMDHIGNHVHQAGQKKAREEAMRERQRQMAMGQQEAEGARPVGQNGRSGQRKPDLNGQDSTTTPPGETPGPARQQAVAAGDRDMATFQGGNQRGSI